MDINLDFLEEKGIDTTSGMEYTGGKAKYLSALKRYYLNYEGNRNKLVEFLEKDDLENYGILVHALKSNSRMVGATSLAEFFESLEHAAGEGNSSFIEENKEKALREYGEFVELIRPIGEADIEKPADEISGETALEVVKELLAALDDFDDEKSMELAKKLSGYPFRPRQRDEMNRAMQLIADFNYDDAAAIIGEVAESIE